MKYDIIQVVNFLHRIESRVTEEAVNAYCSKHNYVWLKNRGSQIGVDTTEAVVVPRVVFDRRPDLR